MFLSFLVVRLVEVILSIEVVGEVDADVLLASYVVGTVAGIEVKAKVVLTLHKVASIHVLLHPVFVFALCDGGSKEHLFVGEVDAVIRHEKHNG